MSQYLSERFFQLSKMQGGEGEKSSDTKRKTIELGFLQDYTQYVELIQESLESQRDVQKKAGLKRFHHDTDHKRVETMSNQGPSIFYYAERAFSIPYDYTFRPSDFSHKKEEYINALVFQAELISDDFLIHLDLLPPPEKLTSLKGKTNQERSALRTRNIQAKIACIPGLKKILAGAKSLQTGIGKRMSGRIVMLSDGKYIVFHEQKRKGEAKNKPKVQYIPHVYQDIYALYRSMQYGKTNVSERLDVLPTIHAELETLYTNWQILSEEKRRSMVNGLLEKMSSYESPYIKNALERLLRIQYQNPIQDSARVLGSSNDISGHIHEQEGKRSAILHQAYLISHRIKGEEIKFENLATLFMDYLGKLDHDEILQILQNENTHTPLSKDFKGALSKAIQTLRTYINETKRDGFIGLPFSLLTEEIESILNSIPTLGSKDTIRALYKTVLVIKKFAFILTLFKIKNILKSNGSHSACFDEIKNTKNLFEKSPFPKEIELRPSGNKKFEIMTERLNEITHLLVQDGGEGLVIKSLEGDGI